MVKNPDTSIPENFGLPKKIRLEGIIRKERWLKERSVRSSIEGEVRKKFSCREVWKKFDWWSGPTGGEV